MIPASIVLAHVRGAWRRALLLAVIVLQRVRGVGPFRLVALILAVVLALGLMAAGAYTALTSAATRPVRSITR